MTLTRFMSLWTHPNSVPGAVAASDLDVAERRLQTQLPLDYRDAILQFGLPRPTIELLDAICDRGLDLSDVSDFLDPKEIVQVTEYWRALGLPEELVAFATDCMGNLFCFPTDTSSGRELPVFFWDHDSKQVDTVAPSFTRWIEDYCGLSPN